MNLHKIFSGLLHIIAARRAESSWFRRSNAPTFAAKSGSACVVVSILESTTGVAAVRTSQISFSFASRDWTAIKTAVKGNVSDYLFKTTKRNPMVLPVIMEV